MTGNSLTTGTHCPNCSCDLRGEEIPEKDRRFYGGKTHFRRGIAVQYQDGYDGVSEYRCPDCGCREGRWSGRILAEGEFEQFPQSLPGNVRRSL